MTNGGVQQSKEFTFRAPPVALTRAARRRHRRRDHGEQPRCRLRPAGVARHRSAPSSHYHFPVDRHRAGRERGVRAVPHDACTGEGRDLRRRPGEGRDRRCRCSRAGRASPVSRTRYYPRLEHDVRAARRAGYVVDRLRALGHRVHDLPVVGPDRRWRRSSRTPARARSSARMRTCCRARAGSRTAPTSPTVSATTTGGCRSATTRTTTACSTLTFHRVRWSLRRTSQPSHLDERGVPVAGDRRHADAHRRGVERRPSCADRASRAARDARTRHGESPMSSVRVRGQPPDHRRRTRSSRRPRRSSAT